MTQLLAMLAFLMLAGGIVMCVFFLIGTRKPPRPTSMLRIRLRRFWVGPGRTARQRAMHQSLLIAALIAGAVTWLVTGWPVGGIIVALAIPGIPWLFSASNAEKRAVARLGALEAWTRRISDYVRNGIGLQAAI